MKKIIPFIAIFLVFIVVLMGIVFISSRDTALGFEENIIKELQEQGYEVISFENGILKYKDGDYVKMRVYSYENNLLGATVSSSVNNADTFLYQGLGDTNFGSGTTMNIGNNGSWNHTGLMQWTFPSETGTISQISLYLYSDTTVGSGDFVYVNDLLRTDWVESEATWNSYKSGSSWTTAGARGSGTDYDATVITSSTVVTTGNWQQLDLYGGSASSNITESWGDTLNIRLITDETSGEYISYNTKEASSNKPYIEITYTPPAPAEPDWNKVSFADGDEGNSYHYVPASVSPDDSFFWVGGATVQVVKKVDNSDLSFIASSPNYLGQIRRIKHSGDYIYVAGQTAQDIKKYNISDLSLATSSDIYGGSIFALDVDNDNNSVFIGGNTIQRVFKYTADNLDYVTSSTDYGGQINALLYYNNYVYVAGTTTKQIYKLNASDLSFVTSSSYSPMLNGFNDLTTDGTYIYGNTGDGTIFKYNLSDLDYVNSTNTSNVGRGIYVYNNIIYACGASDVVVRYNSSDLSSAGSSSLDYGGDLFLVFALNNFVYSAGQDNKIYKYNISDLSLFSSSTNYGGDIYSITF